MVPDGQFLILLYGGHTFSSEKTGLPSTQGQNLQGGSVGFPYANFMLGCVNNGRIGYASFGRLGESALALFAQDSRKAARLLGLKPMTCIKYG